MRRFIEFFTVPGWARRLINKYREVFGDDNVRYSVLDRNNVVISFRKDGKWYRSYCSAKGIAIVCIDENIGILMKELMKEKVIK